MEKKINFILLSINAYASYPGRDMAGAMRVKNLFDPLLKNDNISISNLIMLDKLEMQHDGHTQSVMPNVNCISIGYKSLINPSSIFKFLNRGIRFINANHQKSSDNIIYNYQYPDIRNILLLLYAKYKGYKIIFDIVEDKKHDVFYTKADRMRIKLSLFFFRLIPYYADGVFVISNKLMEEINKISKNKIPVSLLPISVNFTLIDMYKGVKESDGTIKIFYGGSFAQKDGLEYLLEAIEELAKKKYRFKLVLTGKGQPEDMERVFGKIRDKSLVDYKGYVSTEDYFKLLNSADICCMTRNDSAFANAGFPFKMGEFLAAGKVIVASRVGDVDKYVKHKESAYLVSPANAAEILSGLIYCMDNLEVLTQTMGKKAREVALQYFDANASSKYMLEKCTLIIKK